MSAKKTKRSKSGKTQKRSKKAQTEGMSAAKKSRESKVEAKGLLDNVVEFPKSDLVKRGRKSFENVSTITWLGLGVGSLLGLALFGVLARRTADETSEISEDEELSPKKSGRAASLVSAER